MISSKASIKSD
jgi:ADP-ribose pyrophosphatase